MAKLTVDINGRPYTLACDEGEEKRLGDLARYFDKRVRELSAQLGQIDESRLMLLAGLMVTDDLSDAMARIDELENAGRAGPRQSRPEPKRQDAEMAHHLKSAAERIEAIAHRLAAA